MILLVYSVLCSILTFNMLKTKFADDGLVLFCLFSPENKSCDFIGNVVKGNKTAKMPIKRYLGIAFELSPLGMFRPVADNFLKILFLRK